MCLRHGRASLRARFKGVMRITRLVQSMFERRHTRNGEMIFLGAPNGEGVNILENELNSRLSRFSYVDSAYLSNVEIGSENRIGLALIIDSSKPVTEIGEELAVSCTGLVPMDMYFFEHLARGNSRFIRQKCKNVLDKKNA